jgi:hypothetical protein
MKDGEPLLVYYVGKNKFSETPNKYSQAPVIVRNATKNNDDTYTVLESDVYKVLNTSYNKKFVVDSTPAPSPKDVVYTAVFFDTQDIVNQFPQVHPNLYSHHSTNEFKPQDTSNLNVGETRSVNVIGRLTNDKVDVLLVDNPLSKNKFPHITLSTADGVKPFESNSELENNINDLELIEGVTLTGVVGYFNGTKEVTTKFQKESSNPTNNTQSVLNIVNNLSEKFNIPYVVDTTMNVAGKVVNGVVYINPNLAGLDTAFHEFAHPFIALYKTQNPTQYNTLVNEVLKNNEIMGFVRSQNPELSEEDLLEEAVVEAIGRLAAKKLNAVKDKGLVSAIRRFFENLSKIISKTFKKGVKINELTTLDEIADLFINDNISLDLSDWANFDVARYQKRSTNVNTSFDYAFDQLDQMNLDDEAKTLIAHTIRKLNDHQKDVVKSATDGSYVDISGAPMQRLTDYIDNTLGYGYKPKPGEPVRAEDEETDALVWGNISDYILDLIIQGTTDPAVIKQKVESNPKLQGREANYSEDALDSTIDQLTKLINEYKENYIVLGQVVFNDGKIAGTADIVLIDSLGRITVKDLKTSVKEFGKLSLTHPKAKRYAAQVTGYTALAKVQGFNVTQNVGIDALNIKLVDGKQVQVVELEESRDLPFLSSVYKSIYTEDYQDEGQQDLLDDFEKVINKVKSALADKIAKLEGEKRKGITAERVKYRRILQSLVNVEHVEASVGFVNSLYKNVVQNEDPKQNNWTLIAKLNRLVKEIKSGNLDPMEAIDKFSVLKAEAETFSGVIQDLRNLQLDIQEQQDILRSEFNIDFDVNEQIQKLNELVQVFDRVENEFKKFNKQLVSEELGKYIKSEGQSDYLENKLTEIERRYEKVKEQIAKEEEKDNPNDRQLVKLRRKLSAIEIEYERVQQQRPSTENILNQFEKGIFEDLNSFELRATSTINSSNLILSSFAMKIKRMLLESQAKSYKSVEYLSEYLFDFKENAGINASNSKEFYDLFIEESVKEISRDGQVEEDLMFVRDRDYKTFYENFNTMKEEVKNAETSEQGDVIYYNWLLENTEFKQDVIVKDANGNDVYLEKSADTLIAEMKKELTDNEFDIWWNKHVREVRGVKVINDSRFYKPIESKYKNSKFDLLQASPKAFSFYQAILGEYFSAQLRTPKSEMDYSLPNISKNYSSKIMEDGFWSTSVKDTGKAIQSLRYGLTDMSKKINSNEVPIPFADKVKMENKSRDIFSSVLAFTYESNLYEGRNEMKFFSQTLSDILKDTDVYTTDSLGKKVLKKSNDILRRMNDPEFEEAYEVKKGGNIGEFIDDYIEKHIFGVDEIQSFVKFNMELNSISSKVMKVVAFTQLGGLNVIPAIAQRLQGAVLNRIEAYAKQYISRSSWLKASKMHAKYYALDAIKDFNNPLKKSLLGQILEQYNPYQESFTNMFGQDVNGNFAKKMMNNNTLFFFMRQAESPKAIMMLSLLEETKLVNNAGEEVSLLDAYELDAKGKIKFKDDIDTSSLDLLSNGIVDMKTKNRGDALNKGIHGIMNSFDAPEYKRYWYGKLLFFYRNWVVPGFQKRFKKFHYDIELGDHAEGSYRMFYDKMLTDTKNLGVLFLDTFRSDKQSEYTDFEKITIRKAAIEMAFIMATGALAMLLTSLAEGEDDEEYKKALSYALFFTMRLNSELSFYGGLGDPREGFIIPPINDARKMITQPTFVYPYIDKTIRLLKQLGSPTETYDRKSGMFDRGDSKLLARFYSMFGISGITANPDELIKVLQLQTN